MSYIYRITRIDQPRVYQIDSEIVEAHPGQYLVAQFDGTPVEVIPASAMGSKYFPVPNQADAWRERGVMLLEPEEEEQLRTLLFGDDLTGIVNAKEITLATPNIETVGSISAGGFVSDVGPVVSHAAEEMVVQPEAPADPFRLDEEHGDAGEAGPAGETEGAAVE